MVYSQHDPLARLRAVDGVEIDVLVSGTVCVDIIFTGLEGMPKGGREILAEGMASCPGGIANLAVASRRLGLRTSLASAFSDDGYGDFCWRSLGGQEHIDLSRSKRFPGWHSPVTVSMAVEHDRAMVTHAHPPPETSDQLIGTPPRARAVIVDLAAGAVDGEQAWVDQAQRDGAKLFADVGWDSAEVWPQEVLARLDRCYAFSPNAVEAMAYTRTTSAHEALYAIADRVPLAVVTLGAEGSIAIDGTTGEEVQVPAPRVGNALDPTGAGDVFAAALVLGTLSGWSLSDRLAFANLCAALSVQQFGGSMAAPGWGDITDWWRAQLSLQGADSYHRALVRRYEFLEDLIPAVPDEACRRALATVARYADVEGLD